MSNSSTSRDPALSVVIPALDEAESIAGLLRETARVLGSPRSYEIIVVDDGSRDATLDRLRVLQAAGVMPLRILHHRRRLGQSAALRAGIVAAGADWVVTLDADGQNDPRDIPRLLDALARASGRDAPRLVCGRRRRRRDPWSKRVASRIANRVRGRLLADGTRDAGCGLKLIHRATFLELPFFDHQHRYLPALVAQAGGRVISVEVNHRRRTRGRSKYGVGDRLWEGLVDLLGVLWLGHRSRPLAAEEIDGAARSDHEHV